MHGEDKREDLDAQTETQIPLDKESIERLGRKRPALFPNRWVELSFCFSLLASELLAVRNHSHSFCILTDVDRNTLSAASTPSSHT
jgi:hypothetical protein